jgi:hypothetical protein
VESQTAAPLKHRQVLLDNLALRFVQIEPFVDRRVDLGLQATVGRFERDFSISPKHPEGPVENSKRWHFVYWFDL